MTAADVLILAGRLNLAAAAAILLVLLLRPLTRRALGARLTYALWLLPPVAMLASFAPPRHQVVQLEPTAAVSAAPAPQATMGDLPATLTAMTPPLTVDPATLLLAVWIMGALIAAAATLYAQRAFLRESRQGGVGPAVVGVIAPRIVTPRDFADRFDAEERALILAHEQVHIRRQDLRINALVTAIQCLFWFNPLIHIANRQMRIDQELACDEAVVTRFPKARITYARALVKSQLANRPLPLGCYWPSGTEHPFLERIAMLKKTHIGARRRQIGAAALGSLCAASGLAAWAAIPAETIYETAEPAPLVIAMAAPTPEPVQPQVPAPQPKPADPTPAAPAPAEVCLTNACAEAPAPVAERGVAERCAPPCRVYDIGNKLIPSGGAFVTYFDGEAPVLIKGKIAEVMLRDDGISSEFVVVNNDDGRRWRIIGGSAANMSPDARAAWDNSVGTDVVVRGYQTHDKTCQGGCIANGRDVTRADGSKIGAPAPGNP